MNEQSEPPATNPDQPGPGPQQGARQGGSRRHQRVLAGAALAAGLAVGGAAVAAAVTTTSSTTAVGGATGATVAAQGVDGHHLRGRHRDGEAMERALHGELTVRAPGSKAGAAVTTRVLLVQRGSVTAVSSTSITVKSVDGFTATYPVNSSTKVRSAGRLVPISAIKVGAKVHVLAVKGGAALLIGEGGPHPRIAQPGTSTPGTASGASFALDSAIAEL